MIFKGRELQHIEEGKRIIDLILEKLQEFAKVEKPPSMEGKKMTAMLAPKKINSRFGFAPDSYFPISSFPAICDWFITLSHLQALLSIVHALYA